MESLKEILQKKWEELVQAPVHVLALLVIYLLSSFIRATQALNSGLDNTITNSEYLYSFVTILLVIFIVLRIPWTWMLGMLECSYSIGNSLYALGFGQQIAHVNSNYYLGFLFFLVYAGVLGFLWFRSRTYFDEPAPAE